MLIISSSPGKLEELLGKFGMDKLALTIMTKLPIDNFILFMNGARLYGLNTNTEKIELSGLYVPSLKDLAKFNTQETKLKLNHVQSSETGKVQLEIFIELIPLQYYMSMASRFDGDAWLNFSLIARKANHWIMHESVSKDGGYNLLHMLEDTVVRMTPHLPQYIFEDYYKTKTAKQLLQVEHHLRDNESKNLIRQIAEYYHCIAMWRDSRVQWPIGMTDWNDLRNLDHAFPVRLYNDFSNIISFDRKQIIDTLRYEFDSMKKSELAPNSETVKEFEATFKKMVNNSLKLLYKM